MKDLSAVQRTEEYQSSVVYNKYYKKKFSILGDSISTLEGFNPDGYNVFYRGESCDRAGVHSVNDCWWGKVISFFGGELLINNSWSGSRVARLPGSERLFPSGCSDERTSSLHSGDVYPDVILVYLGTNDWAYGSKIDNEIECLPIELTELFNYAYAQMLKRLRSNYPFAEIWCCTLSSTYMSSNPYFVFPETYNNNNISDYNDEIRKNARESGCRLIELYENHIPYDSIDGSHPNADGMNTLAFQIVRAMCEQNNLQLLNCIDNGDDFIFDDENKNIVPSNVEVPYPHDETDIKKTERAYKEYNPEHDLDYKYAPVDIDSTKVFFDDTIKLYIEEENREIKLESKTYVTLGRSEDSDIRFADPRISRESARFYLEGTSWFVADCGSKNGVKLNGNRLEQYTKYELNIGDEINIAGAVKLLFFKPSVNKKINELTETPNGVCDDERNVKIIEEILHDIQNEQEKGKIIDLIKLLFVILCDTPMHLPVEIDSADAFGGVNVNDLKIGDKITLKNEVHLKFRELVVDNERMVPLFTTPAQANKGNMSTSTVQLSPDVYLPKIIEMNCDIVINFFDDDGLALKKEFVKPAYELIKDNVAKRALSEQDADLPAGTVIEGKYEILKKIAQSVCTKTYLAADKRINKNWAVEVCLKKEQSKYASGAIINEANLIRTLDHPAIPKIIDIIDTDEYVCIVKDYTEGATLEDIIINCGAQPQENVLDWVKQLCDVFGYLHTQNPPLIYRDTKPSNIILRPNGTIVLVDFGLVRSYKPGKSADTTLLGTKGYAAPEQYGSRQSDPRTDIYGLGVTMHRLLTGFDPIKADGHIPPLCQLKPELSKDLEKIIMKCTELNPDRRYQSMFELKNALQKCNNKKQKGIKGIFGNF